MSEDATTPEPERRPAPGPGRGVSRRLLVRSAGASAVAGAVVGLGGGFAGGRASASSGGPGAQADSDVVDLTQRHDFYTGDKQVGITTPQQRHCVFMTFDLTTTDKRDLQVLLARWSAAIAQVMAGRPLGSVQPLRAGGVAGDTGEAYDLEPAALTVTLGLGPGVFDDRLGLAGKKPKLLAHLPQLPSDQLRPELTGGDLCLQACADDPQVAYHAVRDLARMGRGIVNTRWTVMGFGRASAGRGQRTPRNLLGFKDGTRNIKEPEDIEKFVWIGQDADEVDWMRGGTYQVARKIQMNIETWDADPVSDQEDIMGRTKQVGAPITGRTEFAVPDFHATGTGAINPISHIALAAHENNDGIRILRRGYNYTDGINDIGHLDAGLLFIAFMNDPAHFTRLQTKLGRSDRLNEYIAHIGSASFAVPPAPARGHYLAEGLFA